MQIRRGPCESQRHNTACLKKELNYSLPLRYASYSFNTQTTGITYLSKSINKIKKKKHVQKEESYQYLKSSTVPEITQERAL